MLYNIVVLSSWKSRFVQVVFFVILGACGVKSQGVFERTVGRLVGYPISYMDGSDELEKVIGLQGGGKEYRYKTSKGCRWAYIVDRKGIISSWRYLGSTQDCRQQPSWGSY